MQSELKNKTLINLTVRKLQKRGSQIPVLTTVQRVDRFQYSYLKVLEGSKV